MVLQMNGLDPTYPTENNKFQLMVTNQFFLCFIWCTTRFSPWSTLFLIYINDLNQAIMFCKVHHFTDETNLLHLNTPVAKLNKLVNQDKKNLTVWLNANKCESINAKS